MTTSSILAIVISHIMLLTSSDFINCPPDPEACTSTDCGNTASHTRAQYTCSQWPFYAGGFPGAMDSEDEFYLCMDWSVSYENVSNDSNDTLSNAWCKQWTSTEKSEKETEFGICSCTEHNHRYCTKWGCSQTELQFGSDMNEYECGWDSNGLPKYCYLDCSGDSCYEVEVTQDSEITWCECGESTQYKYCDNWYCEEASTDDKGNRVTEKEHYLCTSQGEQPSKSIAPNDDRDRYDDNICWRWSVSVDSKQEFEVAECHCLQPFLGFQNSFCASWKCYESGLHKRHNELWYNFPLAVVLWVVLGSLCLCGPFVYILQIDCELLKYYGGPWFIVFGFASIAHGGLACFVLFIGFGIVGGVLSYAIKRSK